MRKYERINSIKLHGGIHTLEVGLSQEIAAAPGISARGTILEKNTGQIIYLYHINLNKIACGKDGYISNWQDFAGQYAAAIDPTGENTATIRRVDFRIDDYDNSFAEVRKINSAVVRALASLKGCGKVYTSGTAGGGEYHNIHVQSKGGRYSVECYDRRKKTGAEGLTHTRLELRSLSRDVEFCYIPELAAGWLKELELIKSGRLTDHYQRAQELANNDLWELWQQKTASGRAGSIAGFIKEQQDNIYTAGQMVELCTLLGMSKHSAYNCGNKLGIEYISGKEFADHIGKIQSALVEFFGYDF